MKTLETPTTPQRLLNSEVRGVEPAFQAYETLYAAYAALPIIAGTDKFTNFLTDWSRYLAPVFSRPLGRHAGEFMQFVGLVEIAAGFMVAIKPQLGSRVVCAWLLAICVNLLLTQNYYDVVLRDFGLALGALALFRLSREYGI
jgi:uncharacterized membrane protein YphA (DoxX/SURF4 family)